jgi:hypothetical protein
MDQRSIFAAAAATLVGFGVLWGVAARAESPPPLEHAQELGFDAARLLLG